jgi:hypothetical protein
MPSFKLRAAYFLLPNVPGSLTSSYMDSNIWGLLAVPVGLIICFWPALLATILTKPKEENLDKAKK